MATKKATATTFETEFSQATESVRATSLELSDLAQERLSSAKLITPKDSVGTLLAEAHILAILAVAEAVREWLKESG